MMSAKFVPTTEQQTIIGLDDGAYLITAPPGSGKTQVLTERVIRLVQHQQETFRVLALTFTHKAAENMRARIRTAAGDDVRRATTATFHFFCQDVLRHYGEHIGLLSPFTIYDNDNDRMSALRQGLVDDGILSESSMPDQEQLRLLLTHISQLKRELTSAEEAPDASVAGVPLDVAYLAYDRTLRTCNALDYDDIITFAHRLFIEAPRTAKHYRKIYRYIVVDEAQDVSRMQYEMLVAMCGGVMRNVMVVADVNQSIYEFAGGSARFLKDFQRDFSAKSYGLTYNFRCSETIVRVANSLAAHGSDMTGAINSMESMVRAPGCVTAASYSNERTEAQAVVALLQNSLEFGLDRLWLHPGEDPGLDHEDICIIGRNKASTIEVVAELTKENIPHQSVTGRDGLFESKPFLATFAALRVLDNPRDIVRRQSIVSIVPELGQLLTRGSTLRDALTSDFAPKPRLVAELLSIVARVENFHVYAGPLIASIEDVVRRLDRSSDDIDDDACALVEADANTLRSRWEMFCQHVPSERQTVSGLMAELALMRRTPLDGPGVRVLTAHAAKGQEFRMVVIVGMNQGSFPDFRSTRPEQLDEERRVAYVAITRAARRIHLTRPRTRIARGRAFNTKPSQFLDEMQIEMVNV